MPKSKNRRKDGTVAKKMIPRTPKRENLEMASEGGAGDFGISVCMIVKDEEERLPRCLKSLEGFADEIVVVDTGSSDKTIDIAKSFGAIVYEHPWQNNFSLHRNQAIGYAQYQWVFIIDADAELCYRKGYDPKLVRKELSMINNDKVVALSMDAEDIQRGKVTMAYMPVRMFRRGHVRYERRVHNKPKFDGDAVHYPGAFVKHYGYDLNEEQSEKKYSRIMGMLDEQLKDDPTDWEVYFYKNQAYNLRSDHERSIWAGEEYLKHKKELKRFNQTVYYTLFKSYFALRDKENAGKYLMEGLEHAPDDMDLNICLIEFGVWSQRLDLVEKGGEKFLEAYYKRSVGVEDGKKGGFTFTNHPNSLAYCVFALTLAKLQLGVHQLNNFKSIMPAIDESVRNHLLPQLSKDLHGLGLGTLDFTQDKEYMAKLSEIKGAPEIEMSLDPI